MQPQLGYRAWLQQDPNKAWALNYVGNDYNNGKGGAGYSGTLQDYQIASSQMGSMGLPAYGNATDLYNKYNTIMGYANDYANYLGGGEDVSAAYGGGGSVGDAATAAYYDDQVKNLEGQVGRLDQQQQIGLDNIGSSYNKSRNRLNEQKAVAERDYVSNKDKNVNNYLQARNGIMQNTRATSNSLQRLLGLGGSGYSSAALEQAPYAAAMQGSQNLNGAQQTYNNNSNSLETAWGDTMRGFNNSVEDLDQQKFQQENSLRASIAQTRASLLDQISQGRTQAGMARGQNYATAAAARGGYQAQIDSLLNQIVGYGNQYANPVMNAGDVKYTAPNQKEFALSKFTGPTTNGGAASDVSPTFLNLLTGGQRRDEFGNLIG